jgi:uncharacterized protein DUF397
VGQHAQPQVVEVDSEGLIWVKSSASNGNDTACVEVARGAESVLLRDSRDRNGPQLTLPIATWQALTTLL